MSRGFTIIEGLLSLGVIAIVLLFLLGPFGLIWALNVLFALAIPFSVKTWFAALVLLVVTKNSVSKS